MAIPPPDAAQLAALNKLFAFGLSEAEQAEMGPAVASTFAASDRVEELYEATAPQTPQRQWAEPVDNALGAWYVTTSIPGAASGPLAGKTIYAQTQIGRA